MSKDKQKAEKAIIDEQIKAEELSSGNDEKSKKMNVIQLQEKQAEKESEEATSGSNTDDNIADAQRTEAIINTEQEIPAEIEAVNEVKPEIKRQKSKTKKRVIKNIRSRSKKYRTAKDKINKNENYKIEEAIKLVKSLSYAKFDATVELHIKLAATKKGEIMAMRGTVKLPCGAAKQSKVVVAMDEIIEKIEKGKIEFDILLATPAMMPRLAKVAKILGPKGMMPSPKSGTVTDDPQKTMEELSSGLVEYKTDAHGNIHMSVGKVSWDDEKIASNIAAIIHLLPKKNIVSATLSTTISPGVKIEI